MNWSGGEIRGEKNNLEVPTGKKKRKEIPTGTRTKGMQVLMGKGGRELQDLLVIFVRGGKKGLKSCVFLPYRIFTYI